MTVAGLDIAAAAGREDWLAQVVEEPLDPGREIVDPHHHFWSRPGGTYELAELWRDTGAGHNVVATVFIECRSKYDREAPEALRPVGETHYVAALAARAERHPGRAQVAGIVAHADLAGAGLDAVLDAHEAAAGGRLVGIRHAGAWQADMSALSIPGRGRERLYGDPAFRRGVARLGARGLSYDTWHYHHQSADFLDLARAVPETVLVLDHCATPLGVGEWANRRDAVFGRWKDDMAALAECPNVVCKLGGLAMPDNGWGWHERPRPPGSDEFAAAYAPWYGHMIDCFGPKRCMFESNFPVDRVSVGYGVLWNAFKKIASGRDEAAQAALFSGTARRVYRL